ncbi:hypothetical protein LJC60_08055, partial [Ruminococcaceae bacterium OttesenSCG-928-D13]|nr:hypothetical protein [Ruminococcaceae bacterium OttesenSCG-928-D13]
SSAPRQFPVGPVLMGTASLLYTGQALINGPIEKQIDLNYISANEDCRELEQVLLRELRDYQGLVKSRRRNH